MSSDVDPMLGKCFRLACPADEQVRAQADEIERLDRAAAPSPETGDE